MGLVDNTADMNKPVSTAQAAAISTAISNLVSTAPSTLDTLKELATALSNDANFSSTITTLIGTKAPLANPTFTGTISGITKSMVGLSNVDNTTDLNKPISIATQAALDLKVNLNNLNKAGVGLGNVDNTSDLNKPISTATQAELSKYQNKNKNLNNINNTITVPTKSYIANFFPYRCSCLVWYLLWGS